MIVAQTIRGARRIICLAPFVALVLSVAACSKNRTRHFGAGNVEIGVFSASKPGSSGEVAFEVSLPEGHVTEIPYSSRDTDPAFGTNARGYSGSAVVSSPNGVYAAGWKEDWRRFALGPRDVFFLRNTKTGEAVFESKFGDKIDGFVWSPNSDAVAVLSSSSRASWNPKYWLAALSGHPVQFDKYRLRIIDTSTDAYREIEIPYESMDGFGVVRRWQVSRMAGP